MTRRVLAISIFIIGLCATHASAQFFGQLGNNLGGQQTRFLYSDTVTESLYVVGGAYGEIGGAISPGVIRWDGSNYHAVGCGFEWDCVSPMNGGGIVAVRSLVRWNGALYAGGDITTSNGVVINHVARFDGTNWQPLAGGTDGPVRNLRSFSDGLYAAGWFTYADTVLANGLARWDGTRWHRVHNLPDITPSTPLNYINDVAIFQGTTYICGNFRGPQDSGRHCLAYFNGSEWVGIGDGFQGSLTKLLTMEVHDSLLYIAGAFANDGLWGPTTNPSNGVVAWDGLNWVDLAGGTLGSSLPWVTDIAWRRDTLYASGDFDHIGGVDAGHLAYWDGHRWCSMAPYDPDTYIGALAFFRDTLFMAGIFYNELDTVRGVAKWLGGDHVEACGVPLGLPEPGQTTEFHVYPNPAEDLLQWTAQPGNINALVLDATGRVVRSDQHAQASIALHGLAPGCYTLLLSDVTRGTRRMARFIKR